MDGLKEGEYESDGLEVGRLFGLNEGIAETDGNDDGNREMEGFDDSGGFVGVPHLARYSIYFNHPFFLCDNEDRKISNCPSFSFSLAVDNEVGLPFFLIDG